MWCQGQMLATVLIFLCGCTLQTAAQDFVECPMWHCNDAVYRTNDLTACLNSVEQTGTCIQDILKQSDVCQLCDKWAMQSHTAPGYLEDLRNNVCYYRDCKFFEVSPCLVMLAKVLTFLDTSKVDDITSCMSKWNPGLGVRTCLKKSTFPIDIPEFVDPIELGKQILGEIKGGCDPIMPLLQCRQHLKPFSRMILGYHIDSLSVEEKTKAIRDATDCMEKAIKKYPCKTIQSLLPTVTDMATKLSITRTQNLPDADDVDKKYCGNSSKFSLFFRK